MQDRTEVAEGTNGARVVAGGPVELEGAGGIRLGGHELAAKQGERRARPRRLGARRRVAAGRVGEPPPDALEPFAQVAADVPEPPERGCEAQLELRVAVREPVERGAQVVVLRLEPVEPACLVGARQLGLGALGEREEVRRVSVTGARVRRRQLGCVLPHDFEHPVPVVLTVHDAGVDERRQPGLAAVRPTDCEHRVHGETACEGGEPRRQPLLRRREQVEAPVDGGTHGPVPQRHVARAVAERREPGVEQARELVGRDRAQPRCRELDREREAVEPPDDLGDLPALAGELGSRGGGTLEEELARGPVLERSKLLHVLRGQPQHAAARRQDPQLRGGLQQLGRRESARDEMLDVVEHEQQLALVQVLGHEVAPAGAPRLAEPQGPPDGGKELRRVADRGEVDEDGSVRQLVAYGVCNLERHSRLPDAAGAEQGDQPPAALDDEVVQLGDLPVAADRGRRRKRERSPRRMRLGGRREGRVVAEDPLLERAQLVSRLQAELLDERGARGAVGRERVRLAPRPVERQHQQRPGTLPQRVLRRQALELGKGLAVPPERQLRLEALLPAGEPQLVEAARLERDEGLAREVGEGVSPPEGERPAVQRLGDPDVAVACGPPRIGEERLEARGVELAVLDPQNVAGRPRHEAVLRQCATQLRDVDAEHAVGGRRRLAVPQELDQRRPRHHRPRAKEKGGEQRTRPARAQLERPVVVDDLERAEHPELHDAPILRAAD